jgi:hypothetical protein
MKIFYDSLEQLQKICNKMAVIMAIKLLSFLTGRQRLKIIEYLLKVLFVESKDMFYRFQLL